ncbi:MAG: LuxR C-terminal-related transcriptional regulator [Rhodothermales bacterium]
MLLVSKVSPPRVRHPFVERSRLDQKLDESKSKPLTLVAAPAGSGKTALVASWASRSPTPVAWFSADEDDSDAVSFWNYIIQAIQTTEPSLGVDARSVLQSPNADLDAVVYTLIEEITWSQFILIIDDYHRIRSDEVDRSLELFTRQLPEGVRCIIISREEPRLSISRRRVEGTLAEIGFVDLQFDVDEVDQYCTLLGEMRLDRPGRIELAQRTEGWIAGLQLAMLTVRGHENPTAFVQSLSGEYSLIADYLADEILDTQPPHIREFLLATSVLRELRDELCAEVMGTMSPAECHAVLRELQRANLFVISLDDRAELFRYHQLFATSLASRFERESPEAFLESHRRAARWYANMGIPDRAFWHARQMGDLDQTIEVVDGLMNELVWRTCEYRSVQKWLQSVPPQAFLQSPRLCITAGWLATLGGQQAESAQALRYAAGAIRTLPSGSSDQPGYAAEMLALDVLHDAREHGALDEEKMAKLWAILEDLDDSETAVKIAVCLSMGESYCIGGFPDTARGIWESLYDVSLRSGNELATVLALVRLHDINFVLGDLNQRKHYATEISRIIKAADVCHPLISASGAWTASRCQYDQGQLDLAEKSIRIGLQNLSSASGLFERCLNVNLAEVLAARGDFEAAIQVAEFTDEARHLSWSTLSKPALMASLYLQLDDPITARYWIDHHDFEQDQISLRDERNYVVLVELMYREGRTMEADALHDRLVDRCTGDGHMRAVMELSIVRSLACFRRGDNEGARHWISHALMLAAPHRYVTMFATRGGEMREMLKGLAVARETQPFVSYLLRRIPGDEPKQPFTIAIDKLENDKSRPSPEMLSHRETEVLALIAAGYANKEIADLLSLTLNTVKVHTRNIYRKLDVGSRTQAISRAKSLKILRG